jgi:hypothetical protein
VHGPPRRRVPLGGSSRWPDASPHEPPAPIASLAKAITALMSRHSLPTGGHMSRRRRPLAALGLIAMVVPISSCGSSGSAGTSTAGNAQKAVKFAECMRSNGVSRFPDPSASGDFTIDGVVNGSSLDPNAPAFTQALSACKDLEPAGFTGSPRSPQQTAAALKFAQCIRTNGVPDFPDPANGQPLVDTNRIPSAATSSGMSILNAAMQKCHDLGAAAIGGQP